MTVTSRNVFVWTVTRGVNGTTAAAHASGASVYPADEATTADTGGKCLITNRPSFAATSGGIYGPDRFLFVGQSGGTIVSRQTFTPGQTDVPGEPEFFCRLTNMSSVLARIYQRIESVRTLAGKTVTLSFYARGSVSGTMGVECGQNFGTGGSTSRNVSAYVGDMALTTTWKKFSITFIVPSVSGKTIGANSHIHVGIGPDLYQGSLDIALIQLEEGSVATPFEQRHPATELSLCKRYTRRMGGATWTMMGSGYANSATTVYIQILFEEMRALPSLLRSGNFVLGNGSQALEVAGMSIFGLTKNAATISCITTGATTGLFYNLVTNNDANAYILLDAEL